LLLLATELDRLHFHPLRQISVGRYAVVDVLTWLVNGRNIKIGSFTKISAFSTVIAGTKAEVRIGENTIIGPNVTICAINHGIADLDVPIRYQAWVDSVEGSIDIGANVWIGAGAVILPGAKIGDGAVIGAGSIVRGSIPANHVHVSMQSGKTWSRTTR
jgi:acetyltransferase-like isoleucine patch superfamily enzyme